jgi:hypothetical protein
MTEMLARLPGKKIQLDQALVQFVPPISSEDEIRDDSRIDDALGAHDPEELLNLAHLNRLEHFIVSSNAFQIPRDSLQGWVSRERTAERKGECPDGSVALRDANEVDELDKSAEGKLDSEVHAPDYVPTRTSRASTSAIKRASSPELYPYTFQFTRPVVALALGTCKKVMERAENFAPLPKNTQATGSQSYQIGLGDTLTSDCIDEEEKRWLDTDKVEEESKIAFPPQVDSSGYLRIEARSGYEYFRSSGNSEVDRRST